MMQDKLIEDAAYSGQCYINNEITLAALADMEQSKGKGIRGKNVSAALAELKAEDRE
jgi:hypothetical protein